MPGFFISETAKVMHWKVMHKENIDPQNCSQTGSFMWPKSVLLRSCQANLMARLFLFICVNVI